jgi:hypothetical protein
MFLYGMGRLERSWMGGSYGAYLIWTVLFFTTIENLLTMVVYGLGVDGTEGLIFFLTLYP